MQEHLNKLLAICEQEKLHLSGAIQSFGAMVALDENLVITHASENMSLLFDSGVDGILGTALESFTGNALDPTGGFGTDLDRRRMILGVRMPDNSLQDALVSRLKGGYLVEFQPAQPQNREQFRFSHHLSGVMRLSRQTQDIKEIMNRVNAMVREIAGFEKSMIYQFQEDWSGEVVAEEDIGTRFPAYMGLRFPASDIPKIARDLYTRLPYRLIHDARADSVAILSRAGTTETVDLTYADLRSVSPVHMEYLANMDVGSSFSLPIMVGGELWGLFALHHPEPRYLSVEQRYLCADVAHTFALTLMTLNTQQRIVVLDALDRKIGKILEEIDVRNGTPDDLRSVEPAMLDMMGCSGGAMVAGDSVVTFGKVPDAGAIREIDAWFRDIETDQSVFSTECLSDLMPGSFKWKKTASGLMATQSMNRAGSEKLYIYWYRPELPTEVNWAGNPSKRVVEDDGKVRISPRESFARWTEITEARSKVWTQSDRAAAAKFRAMVLKSILK